MIGCRCTLPCPKNLPNLLPKVRRPPENRLENHPVSRPVPPPQNQAPGRVENQSLLMPGQNRG